MNGHLVAVDPAVRSAGVALFSGGRLADVARVTCPGCDDNSKKARTCEVCKMPAAARCLRFAQEIMTWVVSHEVLPNTLAVEWPQIYRTSKSKGDPNDLVYLAGVGCAVAGMLVPYVSQYNQTLEVLSYKPREWVGNLPKAKTKTKAMDSPRARRIESRLVDTEMPCWRGVGHDEIDAIGIGLFALGRLERRRALRGTT